MCRFLTHINRQSVKQDRKLQLHAEKRFFVGFCDDTSTCTFNQLRAVLSNYRGIRYRTLPKLLDIYGNYFVAIEAFCFIKLKSLQNIKASQSVRSVFGVVADNLN